MSTMRYAAKALGLIKFKARSDRMGCFWYCALLCGSPEGGRYSTSSDKVSELRL